MQGKEKKQISAEAYYVSQQHGTEPAFSGNLNDNKEPGEYVCVCCGSEKSGGLPMILALLQAKGSSSTPSIRDLIKFAFFCALIND